MDGTRNTDGTDRRIGTSEEAQGRGRVFVADTDIQREVSCGFDVVLKEKSIVPLVCIEGRLVDGLHKAQRSAVQEVGETRERPSSL